ncbi:Spy/CpxP family protein refolding chaperone [Xanthobacter sediminis]
MKRAVIAAATAAFLAGSAVAHAQSAQPAAPQAASPSTPPAAAPATPSPASPAASAAGPSKYAAVFETRIADLKAGLKLTPDQEKLWPAFETTLRTVIQDRATRMADFRAARQAAQSGERPARPDMVARVRAAADRMSAAATELRQVADGLDPLYKSFDAAQKKYFDEAARKGLRGFFGMPHPPRGDRPQRG